MQKKGKKVKYFIAKWSGYGFRDPNWAARQAQYDITLPLVLFAEMIQSELAPCVSVHLPTH